MKIVYIAHPISGDTDENIKRIKAILRQIVDDRDDVLPFAPYLVELSYLNDKDVDERRRGIKHNKQFFYKGVIDEVWLYGDMISDGMSCEVMLAFDYDIPVFAMNQKLSPSLNYLESKHPKRQPIF